MKPVFHQRVLGATALATALTMSATGCSLIGGEDDSAADKQVVLVAHDSFYLPDELIAEFEKDSGIKVKVTKLGDAGKLTNTLVLNANNPEGDVAFGVDNAFATRALEEDVFAKSDTELPAGAEDYVLPGDEGTYLTPVDTGNVCINIDDTWFAKEKVAPPTTLEDLTKPAYKDLLVIPGAATSSPGLAFLLTTIDEFGDDWPAYWEDLMANGASIAEGWTEAYQGEFTQGGGKGKRPIVVSYDSSPAFTVADGATSTSALLDTCFRQIEYAGVLAGADNPEGAQELVDFLVSKDVQAALPESMYVFPVASGIELPAEWAKFATTPTPEQTHSVDPTEIAANRADWLTQWSDIISR